MVEDLRWRARTCFPLLPSIPPLAGALAGPGEPGGARRRELGREQPPGKIRSQALAAGKTRMAQ